MLRPFRQAGHGLRRLRRAVLQSAKQRRLPALPVRDDAGRARQRPLKLPKQRGARLAQAIARAALDHGLQDLAIHRAAIHALAQVGQRAEPPAFAPALQDRLHGNLADAFDGRQPEADGPAGSAVSGWAPGPSAPL